MRFTRRQQMCEAEASFVLLALAGAMLLASAAPFVAAASALSVEIDPQISLTPTPQGGYEASANVWGPDADRIAVTLYYRDAGESGYSGVEMKERSGVLCANLPGDAIEGERLEYFLLAEAPDGASLTVPPESPAESPLVVALQTSGEGGGKPSFLILSPQPNELVPEDGLVIAISLLDPARDTDLGASQVFLDDEDITHLSSLSPDLIVYAPEGKSPPGEHSARVRLVSKSGTAITDSTWSFRVASGLTMEKEVSRLNIQGGGSVDLKFDKLTGAGSSLRQEPARTHILKFGVSGRYSFLDYKGSLFLTTDEDSKKQPRNRYDLTLKTRFLSFSAGDVFPSFSPLVFWGKRIRGYQATLDLWKLKVSFVRGQTKRAVEGYAYTTIDTVSSDTTVAISPGTPRRDVMALRTVIGSEDKFTWAFDVLKARDDTTSIRYRRNPKDNIVVGTDMMAALHGRKAILEGGASFSLLTQDIEGGPLSKAEADSVFSIELPFDPADYGDILILNASTTPLDPRDLSSVAYWGAFRGNILGNVYNVSYKRVGSAFSSVGSPSLQSDKAGPKVTDSFGLLRRQLVFSLAWETFKDNLSKDKKYTKETTVYGGMMTIAPRNLRLVRNLNFRYQLYRRENDAKKELSPVADSLSYRAYAIEDKTVTFGVNGSFAFNLLGGGHILGLGFDRVSRTDDVRRELGLKNSYYRFSIQSTLGSNWKTYAGFIKTTNRYDQPDTSRTDADYSTYHFGATRYLMNRRLEASGSARVVKASGGSVASSKLYLNTGLRYKYSTRIEFRADAGLVNYKDDRVEAVGGKKDYQEKILRFRMLYKI